MAAKPIAGWRRSRRSSRARAASIICPGTSPWASFGPWSRRKRFWAAEMIQVLPANKKPRARDAKARVRPEEMLRLAEVAGSIGAFELDLATDDWEWTPQIEALFGFDAGSRKRSFADWERAIFTDDLPKVRAAMEAAKQTGIYQVQFRVRHADGSVHGLAGRGEIASAKGSRARWLRGAYYDISERKELEARLLA